MLKYTEILNKMSAKQKIALIANAHCLADEEYAELGIPRVKFVTLDELFAKDGDGLTPYVLARSWNPELITEVTEAIIRRNCGDANVILVPAPKINLGAEAEKSLSEDPLLAAQLSLAFLSAVNRCDRIGVLPDFYLTRKEIANMDVEPDQKALSDFLYTPFSTVALKGDVGAIICSISKNSGAYEDFNRSLLRRKDIYFGSGKDMLCLCKTYDETVAALEENCIIYTGVELAIQNAYDQYTTLISSIEKGRASMLNLEEALEHKTAINDQMLDAAADKVIDFAFRINKREFIDQTGEDNVKEDVANKELTSDIQTTEATIENTEESMPEVEEEATEETAENTEAATDVETENVESDTEEATEALDGELNIADEVGAEAGEDVTATPTEEVTPTSDGRDEEYEDLLTQAMKKSTVLLKNESGLLPMKNNDTFAILGDVALMSVQGEEKSFAEYFSELLPGKYIGAEKGYDFLEDRSDALIPSAVALAEKASVVFVFLKHREAQNSTYPSTALPANQTALVYALSKCKCKVVAVMCTNTNVDVAFSKTVSAFVLSPVYGKLSAKALADVVIGKASAGGKLTTSFYTSPSKFYKKQRFYKDNGRNKVSLFVGYRFYDTQDITITYPFGFGLKYSNIEISDVRCFLDTISFKVTNVGSFEVDETVEIYVGMEKSKLLRAKKELKEYRTVSLKPGKSEQITVKKLDFKVYDPKTESNVMEDGYHTVYIGTSVNNVKATLTVGLHGKFIMGSAPKMEEYLQSQTNITSNEFTLEAKHDRMANYKNLRNAGLVCLLVAILVAIMSFTVDSPLVPLIAGLVLFLVSLALLVTSRSLKRSVKRAEAVLIAKNKKMFEDADAATSEKLDDLFLKEFKFDVTDTVVVSDEADEIYRDTSAATLNDDMSFAVASADLKQSLLESGIDADEQLCSGIIASFASSKLILAKADKCDNLDAFVEGVANYYSAKLFTEELTEAHLPADRLLKVTQENGTSVTTAVLSGIISADENPQDMHIIYLKNLATAKIPEYLIPYIKYLSNPTAKAEISPKGSDETYVIGGNVWLVAAIERDTMVENVPAYVLEYATVLPIQYTACMPAEERSAIVPITLTDLEYLLERSKARHVLNEDVWKKIDNIEAFASKYSSYKIGNKLWIRTESYISALLSMNTELPIAVDSTLASVILPTLASTLVGKIADADKNLVDEIERVFGEDNVQTSREMLVSKA